MTEDQIERRVEAIMDRLDMRLLRGALTQKQYDEGVVELNRWADQQRFAGRPS
jgi:hypothetical protein